MYRIVLYNDSRQTTLAVWRPVSCCRLDGLCSLDIASAVDSGQCALCTPTTAVLLLLSAVYARLTAVGIVRRFVPKVQLQADLKVNENDLSRRLARRLETVRGHSSAVPRSVARSASRRKLRTAARSDGNSTRHASASSLFL